jgi:hypothetical protein
MAVESAPRGVVTLHISVLGTDVEVSMHLCCALSGTEVEKGFACTVFGRELVDPKAQANAGFEEATFILLL